MSNNLVLRSLEILGHASKDLGKEYTSNLVAVIDDARNVKEAIVRTSTDASDTIAKLKNTDVTKKIHDWFYQQENEMDSSSVGDDFDAGFKLDSNDHKLDGENKPTALTIDSMSDISEKQTSMMVKIGRRQSEQSVANTGEIISVINNRSSEMVTVMNNINKTLIGISDRLDKLVAAQTIAVSREKEEMDKGSLYSDGKLSLMNIFEASKSNIQANPYFTLASGVVQMLSQGGGPEAVAKMGLEALAGKIKIGDKSIDELGKSLNETIGVATQTALNEMINSKPFKSLFKDITKFEEDRDYGTIVGKTYDDKKALFDGMTRMSIISVIPEMLSKINESLSGTSYHLNERGQWIKGPAQNKFNEVTRSAYSSASISQSNMQGAMEIGKRATGKAIPESDIQLCVKALTGVIVMDLHARGTRSFTNSDLKKDMSGYITQATRILCMSNNDPTYWAQVCQSVVLQLSSGMLSASGFVATINQSLQNMIDSAVLFAQSGKQNANQATKVSYEMMARQFYETEVLPNQRNQQSAITKPTTDGNIQKVDNTDNTKYTQADYVRSIFGILNRGINVRIDKSPDIYGSYKVHRLHESASEVMDDKFGRAFKAALQGGGGDEKVFANAVKSTIEEVVNNDTVKNVVNVGQGMMNGQGFLGSMMSTFGAATMRDMLTRAVRGDLMKDIKGFFGAEGKGGQLLSRARDRFSDVADQTGLGALQYDQRVQNAADRGRGFIDGARDRLRDVGDAISQNQTFQNVRDNASRVLNNGIYMTDERRRQHAENNINNINPEYIQDADDRLAAEGVIQAVRDGKLDDAAELAESIKSESLKNRLKRNIDTLKKIKDRRESTDENGIPSIGAALQTAPARADDNEDKPTTIPGKILAAVKGGFSAIGGLIGKIAKATAKLAADGLLNMSLGAKTFMEGMFGGKRRDVDGNVILDENGNAVRDRGLVGLAGAAMKATVKGIAGGVKTAVNGIKNAPNAIANSRVGEMQITRSSDKTVADLLKAPVDTIKTVLGDVGNKFKEFAKEHLPTFSEALSKVSNKAKEWFNKRKENNENNENSEQSRFSKLLGKVKESPLFNNAFMNGLTQGFKQARAKKAARDIERAKGESSTNMLIGIIIDNFNTLIGKVDTAREEAEDQNAALIEATEALAQDEQMDSIDSGSTGGSSDLGGSSSSNSESPQMDSIESSNQMPSIESGSTGGSSDLGSHSSSRSGGSEASMPSVGDAAGGVADAVGDAAGGGGLAKTLGNIFKDGLGSIAKMFGGVGQMLGGLLELVISAVMSLEGIGALMDMLNSIISDGIEPLNGIFEALMDAIKPTVDALKGLLNAIVEPIVAVVNVIIDIIQPLFTAVADILGVLIDIVTPILDVCVVILDAILTPLLSVIMNTLMPIIELAGASLQVISGVLQFGMGAIMGLLGGILTAIGSVIAAIGSAPVIGSSSIKTLGESIADSGKEMLTVGSTLRDAGAEQFKKGLDGIVSSLAKLLPGNLAPDEEEEEPVEEKKDDVKIGTDFGAGDVNTNTINNSWTYTYGSGNTTMNQHSYGNTMNMSERGCGPVVLADAYNRRGGGNLSPLTLASRMAGGGAYEPSRGTSVASMISTGNALGMNMRVGGVTQQSLRQASPDNPITLLGSGTGFGTKRGNNHYVNVLGTDGRGMAYVANPMTGRVERQSATSLTLNSKLGLYGSGDYDYSAYGFDEDTSDAFASLKKLTEQLTGIFNGGGKADQVNKQLEADAEAAKAKQIKQELGDEFDEVENTALEAYRSDNPKRDGESDEAYEARIEKGWAKKYNKYIVQYGGQAAYDKSSAMYEKAKTGIDEATAGLDSYNDSMSSIDLGALGSSSNGTSQLGAEMSPFTPIRHTETKISGVTSAASPVHDYFAATIGRHHDDDDYNKNVMTLNGGWWGKEENPDESGEGKKGAESHTITINYSPDTDKDQEHPAVRAITGGTVTFISKGATEDSDPNGGIGNSLKWRDSAGMYHWYMNLSRLSNTLNVNGKVEPNDVIGTLGNTGDTGRGKDFTLMKYMVTKDGPEGSIDDGNDINPLTYWKFEEAGQNQEEINVTDKMKQGSFWCSTYEDKIGNSKYHEEATKAGLTGAQEAMIAAIAIHEDGAQKIVGEKSLTTVTADSGGQTAFGIMNWIPSEKNRYVGATETMYGSTLAEQLPYMRDSYFIENSSRFGSKVRQDNFNEYKAGITAALGHAPALKPGEAWGPYAETDLLEAMGHYVANALVPAGWQTEDKLAAHMGTAAQAYNWMVKKGWIKVGGGANSENQGIRGRFVSTVTNPGAFGDGYFVSDGGAVLADYGPPSITAVNITSDTSGESPLHEFFGKSNNDSAYSAPGNWYGQRHSPNKSGVGSSGDSHSGIDILWKGGTEGKEVRATTSGTVDQAQGGGFNGSGSNGGCGNNVRILDRAGNLHWYMHMRDDPLVRPQETVEAGQLLGYVGNTGNSYGAHLHYNINLGPGFGGSSGSNAINPLTYFSNYNPTGTNKKSSNNKNDSNLTSQMVQSMKGSSTTSGSKTKSSYGDGVILTDPSTWGLVSGSDNRHNLYNDINSAYLTALSKDNSLDNSFTMPSYEGWYKNDLSVLMGGDKNDKDFKDAVKYYSQIFKYGSGDIIPMEVPPLDPNQLMDYGDNSGISYMMQPIIQRYEIKPDTSEKDAMLKKMGEMTFNVRAKRVEELLEELIKIVDKDDSSTVTTSGPNPDIFPDNSIPEQVTRLAQG